ncbi:CopG family ribbon-helix-helix protein [Nanoarchaeota archaeon]
MDIITVRFQENIIEELDKTILKHNFNSRTEFIREAVRDKLSELSRNELIQEFMKFRGKAKVKTSDKRLREIREEVSKELMDELDKKFS